MTTHDRATLQRLLAQLSHPYGAQIVDDDRDIVADREGCREYAIVIETALRELAEIEFLRGIARDALEDSVMYQRGIVEGRRQHSEKEKA